jgi:hypothetical protein
LKRLPVKARQIIIERIPDRIRPTPRGASRLLIEPLPSLFIGLSKIKDSNAVCVPDVISLTKGFLEVSTLTAGLPKTRNPLSNSATAIIA